MTEAEMLRAQALDRIDREIVRPYLLANGIEPADSGIEWAVRFRTIQALVNAIGGRK